jgi:hypothetical protein
MELVHLTLDFSTFPGQREPWLEACCLVFASPQMHATSELCMESF